MELAIKEMRKKLHLSQAEFAEAVGVTMRTVGSWERGESFPNAEQVWNCALALGCSPNDVLSWDESDRNQESLSDDERQIVDNYRDSSPQWQKNIAMTAKAAASESRKE
jgi:transcriptional regulator with XRE-family HTH domain